MDPLNHTLRKQSFVVQCDTVDCALTLRSLLVDFNASNLAPIIEKVLTESAIPGRTTKIEKLEVDLGDIRLDEFEDVVADRLYRELKLAIENVMDSSSAHTDEPEFQSRLSQLEWYLIRGTLPSPAVGRAFSLGSWFAEIAAEAPRDLAQLIRKVGVYDQALWRIVLQLSDGELRTLIAVLDPEHASLILQYVADTQEIDREEPITTVPVRDFEELLWFLVLSYLVRDAGSGFNRRSFVESIIRGFAESESTNYEEILALVGRGLERTAIKRALASSLPVVISELMRAAHLPAPFIDSPGATTQSEDGEPDVASMSPVSLAALVRKRSHDRGWIEWLVQVLDEDALISLLYALEPEHAAAMVETIVEVRLVHRDSPIVDVGSARLERLVWVLTLLWVTHERGTEFNRKSFLRAILEGLSASTGIEFKGVLATLDAAVRKAAFRAPPRSSLVTILAALLADENMAGTLDSPAGEPGDGLESIILQIRSLADLGDDAEVFLAIWGVLGSLPALDVRRILAAFIPAAGKSGAPLFEAIEAAVGGLGDPRILYVHLIVASLKRQDLDLDHLLAESKRFAGELPSTPSNLGLGANAGRDARPGLGAEAGRDPDSRDLVSDGSFGTDASSKQDRGLRAVGHHELGVGLEAFRAFLQAAPNYEDQGELRRQFHTLISALTIEEIASLLSIVLASSDVSANFLDRAVLASFQSVDDARQAVGDLILGVLAGREIDRGEIVSDRGSSLDESLPDTWSVPKIQAVILLKLAIPATSENEPTIAQLALTLLRIDVGEARKFLASGIEPSVVPHMLRTLGASRELPRIVDRLAGPQAAALNALLNALGALSNSDRPSMEEIRLRFLQEALSGAGDLLNRVLFAVFPGQMSDRVRSTLLASISPENQALRVAIAGSRGIPAEQIPQRSFAQILELFVAGEIGSKISLAHWLLEFEAALEANSESAQETLRRVFSDPTILARLVGLLPDSTWLRLIRLMEPTQSSALFEAEQVLALAWNITVSQGRPRESRSVLRGLVMDMLLSGSVSIVRLAQSVANRFRQLHPGPRGNQTAFRDNVRAIAEMRGSAGLKEAADRDIWPKDAASTKDRKAPDKQKPKMDEDENPIYIDNAGLILAGPFLPYLFETLGMLARGASGKSQWVGSHSASRAVHLLQYLVDGRTSAPEPILVLNKLLCGLQPSDPIEKAIQLTEREAEMCGQLLQAVLQNWSAISTSSVEALRETFLMREGKLVRDGEMWRLQVQRKTLDVLVDQVPWSFAIVYHDWMISPIHVTW